MNTVHRLRSALIGGLAMALANLTAGAVLAPQPAGAAVTMSAAAAGCTVTATVSGLPTEGSWYINKKKKKNKKDVKYFKHKIKKFKYHLNI